MQVASIVPIHYLPLIKGKPYHLCLAHLALNYTEYRDFYKEEAQNGSYVILDNGAAEGETVEVQELLQLAIYLGASEVILPDFIGDYEKTITESYRALHYIKSREDYKGKVMAVPQASSFKSWLTAAEEMLTWPIDTLGIPREIRKVARLMVEEVRKVNPEIAKYLVVKCHPNALGYCPEDLKRWEACRRRPHKKEVIK